LSETILEAINELVHLELLTDSEFAAIFYFIYKFATAPIYNIFF